jgi:hypothetical protein
MTIINHMLRQEIIFQVTGRVNQLTKTFRIILLVVFFTGCNSQKVINNVAKDIALTTGLKPILLRTSTFSIKGYYRFQKPGSPLTVYIEGDGLAYLHRNIPSRNPTPKNPMGLRLASLDMRSNVVYLARPCQYVDLKLERLCSIPFWTEKRFAKEVILAIDEAIDKLASKGKVQRIHLVGYSGGGAVAALVAARRNDIVSIRTVAGYMNHVSLNKQSGVSPLKGSLDPMRIASRLKSIPQIHYAGKQDKIIPYWVARSFSSAVGNKNCSSVQLTNATHIKGWEKVWESAWARIPSCN